MKSPNHPNIIVFFSDQQRFDTTGVHGNPLGLTPNFDRMAQEGAHLFQSFTVQPVCGPARAAMQTGRYATQNGCFCNGIPLAQDQKTLAHFFREAGYHTGYLGKWHLGSRDPVPEEERGGYESWLAANILEFTSDAYDTVLFDEANEPLKLPGYRVDALADAAIRFIDRRQGEPFFLFLSFLEPHHQNHQDSYPAPDGYAERYAGRWTPPDLAALGGSSPQHLPGYYGMVKRLDEALGRVMDALKSLALVDDTVLLYTSDHACHFKTRNEEYKRSCHESSIRVPTALWGSRFLGGGRVRRLTSILDLPPTLLEAAGLEPPETMMGRSVLPLLGGRRHPWPEEVYIQISESELGRALRTERFKYGVTAFGADPAQDPYASHYVETHLYDLEADPYELSNLVGVASYRAVADDLRARLLAQMGAVGEPPAIIESAPVRASGQREPELAAARAEHLVQPLPPVT